MSFFFPLRAQKRDLNSIHLFTCHNGSFSNAIIAWMKKQQEIGRETNRNSLSHTCTPKDQLPLGMLVNLSNFNYLSLLSFGIINPYQSFNVIWLNLTWITQVICKEIKLIESWYLNVKYFECTESKSSFQNFEWCPFKQFKY